MVPTKKIQKAKSGAKTVTCASARCSPRGREIGGPGFGFRNPASFDAAFGFAVLSGTGRALPRQGKDASRREERTRIARWHFGGLIPKLLMQASERKTRACCRGYCLRGTGRLAARRAE
jgi:hypothetical protein